MPEQKQKPKEQINPYEVIKQRKLKYEALPSIIQNIIPPIKKHFRSRAFTVNNNKIQKGIQLGIPIIIPKEFRKNPLNVPTAIHEDQIHLGMFNLMNMGLIQKDVDIGPAFEKEPKIIEVDTARIHNFNTKL